MSTKRDSQGMLIGILIMIMITLSSCQSSGIPQESPLEGINTKVPTIASSPVPTTTPPEIFQDNEAWQAEVDAIKALTRNKVIPESYLNNNTAQEEAIFDPNQLLQPLGNLQLKKGYRLDFVYYYDGGQGMPYLYARQENAKALKTYQAYLDALAACNQADSIILCNHMDAILTDGTEASFFQWVLLHTMGEQFYLYWHANYNDQEIIASSVALARIVEIYGNVQHGSSLTEQQKRQALTINPAPLISIQEGAVSVRVVTFTKWGGFFETIYTLSLDAPHRFIKIETNNLVPYDIDIVF